MTCILTHTSAPAPAPKKKQNMSNQDVNSMMIDDVSPSFPGFQLVGIFLRVASIASCKALAAIWHGPGDCGARMEFQGE